MRQWGAKRQQHWQLIWCPDCGARHASWAPITGEPNCGARHVLACSDIVGGNLRSTAARRSDKRSRSLTGWHPHAHHRCETGVVAENSAADGRGCPGPRRPRARSIRSPSWLRRYPDKLTLSGQSEQVREIGEFAWTLAPQSVSFRGLIRLAPSTDRLPGIRACVDFHGRDRRAAAERGVLRLSRKRSAGRARRALLA
jgi:hypothetical protein